MSNIIKVLLFTFILLLSADVNAKSMRFSAVVVGVHDGDTITVLNDDKTQYKIRLLNIDAPELKQAYGFKAKQYLSDMIYKKKIIIDSSSKDRYGRTLALVWLNDIEVNKNIVENGFAWVYRRYCDDTIYINAETNARNANRGLWSLQSDQRRPPWEWRRGKR